MHLVPQSKSKLANRKTKLLTGKAFTLSENVGKLLHIFYSDNGCGSLTRIRLRSRPVAVDDSKAAVFVNGKICKDPKTVTPNDFFYSGLDRAGNISNPAIGSKVTQVFVNQLPGLNSLGISLVRIDYAPNGLNPPHLHPRSSEILVVQTGTLYVGFITSNPQNPNKRNELFAKVLNPGDVYVFPRGLIHLQYNVGKGNAVAFASLNSQNPGVVTLANAVFGSEPPVYPDGLAKAFQVDKKIVNYLQARPWMQN